MILNLVILAMALLLFVSAAILIRPANGTRPLLVGFMFSAVFGVVLSVVRLFGWQHEARSWFGFVILVWLAIKLWAIYAAALRNNRPFLTLAERLWRRAWGMKPPARP